MPKKSCGFAVIFLIILVKTALCSEIFAVSPINYYNQNEKGRSLWCVVYSVRMLLSHYHIYLKPEEIAKGLNMANRKVPYYSWKSTFSDSGSVEQFLQKKCHLTTQKKIFVNLHPYLIRWIKKNIRENHPIILIYGKWEGHGIVLVGYDSEYIYINDPSGAFFYEASVAFKKRIYPKVWLSKKRISPFEGAGVPWELFKKFMKRENIWGYMITTTGTREEKQNKNTPHKGLFNPNFPAKSYRVIF